MSAKRGTPKENQRVRPGAAAATAFTLIEISIVLLVIALIVGGILVGRDLVRAAEIRQAVGQIEKFEAAVNAFRTKYNCLPGDCAGAADFGFDATSSGNGDGVIGQSYGGPCQYAAFNSCPFAITHEYIDFWYHLGAAGLISFAAKPLAQISYSSLDALQAGVYTPALPFPASTLIAQVGSGWAVTADMWLLYSQHYSPAHSFILGTHAVAFYFQAARWLPATVQVIDAKLDDGLPLSGRARAFSIMQDMNYTLAPPGPPGSARCLTNSVSPEGYNVLYVGTASIGQCALTIKASF